MRKERMTANLIANNAFDLTLLLLPWVVYSPYAVSPGIFHANLTDRLTGYNQLH